MEKFTQALGYAVIAYGAAVFLYWLIKEAFDFAEEFKND